MRATASPRGCTASSITWAELIFRTGAPLLLLPPPGPSG